MAANDGLVIMTPTSISHSGTSATINANGGVDFSAVTALSLNGVFTSDYDNYRIVCRVSAAGNTNITYRLRASGTDATGSDYTRQTFRSQSTTISRLRATSSIGYVMFVPSAGISGFNFHVYGAALASPTATRSITVDSDSSPDAGISDIAGTHDVSTAYDGITFGGESFNITGNMVVFGYAE